MTPTIGSVSACFVTSSGVASTRLPERVRNGRRASNQQRVPDTGFTRLGCAARSIGSSGAPVPYTICRWAKFLAGRTHRLVWHGLDVATVLEVGLERNPAVLDQLAARLAMEPHDTRAMILSLAALHDLGKVIASF